MCDMAPYLMICAKAGGVGDTPLMRASPDLVVISTAGEPRLTLSHLRYEADDISRYRATLETSGLHATADVYSLGDGGLPGFFHKLAQEWRGWDGAEDWRSLESQLALSATSDRLGHLSLVVRVRPSAATEDWTAMATLQLDGGSSLERLTRQAQEFFKP